MQTDIIKHEKGEPWMPGMWDYTPSGVNATLVCPGCGLPGLLDHEISNEGDVTPSVDCPGCSYHETGVKLLGWKPPLAE